MASTSASKFRRLVKGVTRYGRVPKKAAMLITPYTPLQDSDTSLHPLRVDSSASTRDIPTLKYDLYRVVEAHRRTLLMDFLDDSSRLSHSVDIMVLDKSNFCIILTGGAWLHSDEVDFILYFIRNRIHDHCEIFTERVAIVDVFFWKSLYYRFEAHAPVMQKKYIYPSKRSLIPSRDWTLDMNDETMTNCVKGLCSYQQ